MAHRVEHGRRMLRECFENRGWGKTEHSRIPDMSACRNIVVCVGQRRFFDKAVDAERVRDVKRLGKPNVAVAGLRMRRNNAECRQPSLVGERCGAFDCGRKCSGVANQVIGGQHKQRRVGTDGRLHIHRGQCHRRRGIAAEGLQQIDNLWRRDACARIDIIGVKVVVAIGDGDQRCCVGQSVRPHDRFGKQRLAVRQRHERLRCRLAR
jgi:hypothetical protein